MVTESNRYAGEVMGTIKLDKWIKITVGELRNFLGFSVIMGVNQLPEVEDYWKMSEYFHYSQCAD